MRVKKIRNIKEYKKNNKFGNASVFKKYTARYS